MRQSRLFTKTRKEAPADEVAKSAQLLLRGGFVSKEMAGVYSLLPLGLRVMNKIADIIRQEMNTIGGQEVFLTSLQDPEVWKASGRWDDKLVDNWFKTSLKNGNELGLALTHEEALARILADHVNSYRDLPRFVYQIQTKFRNELRAKSGLLRGREFLMKDMYSFTVDTKQLDELYERAAEAYKKVYAAVGLGDRTFMTFASGGIFSKYSHEFQTLCDTGEDTIYLNKAKGLAINHEVFNDEVLAELGAKKEDFEETRSIEVGNIFKLGTKYAEAEGLAYTDEHGKQQPVVMGSYGIGLGRLLATVVEALSDDRGMVWPKTIAPFDLHLIELDGQKDKTVRQVANELCNAIHAAGHTLLHDERDLRAGEKFAESDLIGLPLRVVVSKKTVAAGNFEVKDRQTGEVAMMTTEAIIKRLQS